MKFKYLISDMDGVLLDTENLILKMYIKSADFLGFEFPEAEFYKTIGIDSKGTGEILKDHIPVDFEELYILKERFMAEHINEFGAPEKPCVVEGMMKIKEAGIKTALATSTFEERAMLRLSRSTLPGYFDRMAFGNEIKNGKPAPDIFLLAAERLGADPKECAVFEDSPAGIRAAKSAGMHTVLIPDTLQPDESILRLSDYVAHDFIDAVRYILT